MASINNIVSIMGQGLGVLASVRNDTGQIKGPFLEGG
jgi:hypothetical protein